MRKAVIEGEAYAPASDVYDFFMDFENYGDYSEYVDDVRLVRDGDHPIWEIDFHWWILKYTAKSCLVDYEEDEYIEWKVIKDVNVRGVWEFEETDDDDEKTNISLRIWYDPSDASKANPLRYMPTDELISLIKPVFSRHVDKVLRRVAAEIEGEPRDVDYTVKHVSNDGGDDFLDLVG
ncbi:MAG: SRPBCC family protein [Halobacteria archaeon]|nr:SRPBCC family protein [Halobacteria archaeon]